MIWVFLALIEVLVLGIFWVAGAAVGVFTTLIACLSKAYRWNPNTGDGNKGSWKYTWGWMKYWSTWDNGAAPLWYVKDHPRRPLWLNLWIFSGFRNAFGGNPLNLVVEPRNIKWKSDDGSPIRLAARMMKDKKSGKCKRVYWIITRYEWRYGFHFLFPFSTKNDGHSHFEIRHGWKLYPDEALPKMMVFSFWDTGPRFR